MLRALVLDADQRAALAVVRSLGAHGLTVLTADSTRRTLAGASRFASVSLVHPDMEENPAGFLGWLESALLQYQIDVLLPVTEISTDLVVRHRDRWPLVVLPFAPIALVDALSDKVNLYRIAIENDVVVPRSVIIESTADLDRALHEIGFPCILKPHRSRVLIDGTWRGTTVRRADSEEELWRLIATDPGLQQRPLLYQELIPGRGAGVFALYRDGKPVTWFAHRRLREKPPQGGVSVLSESVVPQPDLVEQSQKLLDAVGWEGIAMVEFRVAPDGRAYLMEINARFWGSLQLAIDAGIDFPALLLEEQLPASRTASRNLRPGCRLRWVLGDVDRLWLIFKQYQVLGFSTVMREVLGFLRPDLSGKTRWEVFRLHDPKPGIREAIRYFFRW